MFLYISMEFLQTLFEGETDVLSFSSFLLAHDRLVVFANSVFRLVSAIHASLATAAGVTVVASCRDVMTDRYDNHTLCSKNVRYNRKV